MPSYFNNIYSDKKTEYAVLNAAIVSFCGFCSAYAGGYISDVYEKKGVFMTKAYVCIFAGLAGIPTSYFCLWFQNNFWFSITFLALEYLFAESWFSPAIAMVLNTISPENRGFAVSVYIFTCTIAGTLATWLLGLLSAKYVGEMTNDDGTKSPIHPEYFGYILFYFILISYGGSLPFFILAGRNYTQVKRKE